MYFSGCLSYCLLIHQFVESFTDLGEVGSEGAVGVVQVGQELRVAVMVEDVFDATVGFGGEVGVDQLEQQIPAAGQEVLHHGLVKGKVHLIKADCRHGPHVEFLLEVLGHLQLFCAETIVLKQHADLDRDLDQVFDDFLSLGFISRMLFGDAVQFIQNLTGGLVNEELHRAFGGH